MKAFKELSMLNGLITSNESKNDETESVFTFESRAGKLLQLMIYLVINYAMCCNNSPLEGFVRNFEIDAQAADALKVKTILKN